jgi:hypothetical protein
MNGLRLLLFGLPGSGKSALLGALVQAAGAQAAMLHGKLTDASGKLAALRDRTYAETLPASTDEVVAYPILFEPHGSAPLGSAPLGSAPLALTLLDCDGRLAAAYLAGKRPLDLRDSRLARAMLEADTVILTLDAASGSEAEAQLALLRRFLTLLQEVRSRRTDVADLPVYLVLTKCDRLAAADDTFVKWMQRIEEVKRRLAARFADFLENRPAGPAFGTIDLHLWATAVRRPPLIDRPPSDEPYGVAELFRQCIPSAAGFDHREQRAGRRLEFAVGGLGLLVVLMGLMAALFVLTQPDTDMLRLEEQVQAVLPEPHATAPQRLRGDLPERLKQLNAIERNSAFDRLPAKTRSAVEQSAAEIASYLETRKRFHEQVKPPFQAKNEAEFDRYEKHAREFQLPSAYADAWAKSGLAMQLARIRKEYAGVRTALADEVAWIGTQILEGKRLNEEGNRLPPELAALDPAKRNEGRQKAEAWFATYLKYSNRPYTRYPGDQAVHGVVAFTYGDLRKFHAIRDARQEWDRVRSKLDETYQYVSKLMTK